MCTGDDLLHRPVELRHKVAAFEMIMRYLQPLPDGEFFCRNIIRVGVRTLLDEEDPMDVLSVWLHLRDFLPACSPGRTCC